MVAFAESEFPPCHVGVDVSKRADKPGPTIKNCASAKQTCKPAHFSCFAMRVNLAAAATTLFCRSNLTNAFTPAVLSTRACWLSINLAGVTKATHHPHMYRTTMAASTSSASASSMPALPAFLSRSYKSFCGNDSTISGQKVRITIGNEAGDADSIVSALVHGYVLSLEEDALLKNKTTEAETTHAALVGVPRADLPLRRETTLLLEMAGVDLDQLLCIDSPPSVASLLTPSTDGHSSAGGAEPLSISLVDHNRIRSSLRHLDDHVVEILDHHEDEGHHTDAVPKGSGARNVAFRGRDALVGSTCTLVAERMLQVADSIASGDDKDAATLDPSASLAVLGVILLDTMDMSPEAGKGTDRDLAAINALVDRTDWSKLDTESMEESARSVFKVHDGGSGAVRPCRAALHDLLRNSKFDETFWRDMSVYDCLRIDYKRFEPTSPSSGSSSVPVPFGMSSVLLPLSKFLSKESCVNSITRYMEEGDVPLLGILTMTIVDDAPHREMLLAGRLDLVDAAAEHLTQSDDAAFLEVEEVDCPLDKAEECNMRIRRFRQGNPKGSRKQVAPILMRFASTLT